MHKHLTNTRLHARNTQKHKHTHTHEHGTHKSTRLILSSGQPTYRRVQNSVTKHPLGSQITFICALTHRHKHTRTLMRHAHAPSSQSVCRPAHTLPLGSRIKRICSLCTHAHAHAHTHARTHAHAQKHTRTCAHAQKHTRTRMNNTHLVF